MIQQSQEDSMTTTTLSAEQTSGNEQPAADPATAQAAESQAPAPDPQTGEGLESLPASWQQEIRKLRDENADRRTKYNEAMAKLDGAKSQEDIDKAVTEYRTQVADLERKLSIETHTAGLPAEAAELVVGTTDEEIKASADRVRALLESAGKPAAPREPNLEAAGGVDPKDSRSTTSGLSPRELARAALSRR